MANSEIIAPRAHIAEYTEQRIPQFKGNPMIGALPPAKSDADMYDDMTALPDFSPEQLTWSDEERVQMIMSLSDFMVPLERHIRLGRTLDSMLRNGYVGRLPDTLEHAKHLQKVYALTGESKPPPMKTLASNPQLSALLMGVPGMGKTSSLKRFFSKYHQLIYHPDHHVYQVTYLRVEMPSDGASVKALALGILHELDKLLPDARYFEMYSKKKQSSELFMRDVARLLHQHFVGFLVADEVQNLLNAKAGKSYETLMTELVSACNDLGVPILFVGTNKAARIFSMDFRTSRRASGHGIEHWDRLMEAPNYSQEGTSDGRPPRSEWREFLEVLWTFQWVRKPVPLDAAFDATMYHLSQGVIDIAIKIFASAQTLAIFRGSETLTLDLLQEVYDAEMKTLHAKLDALRDGNVQDLAQYPDIAPISLQAMVDGAKRRVSARASEAYSLKSSDTSFTQRVAAALVAGGFGEDLAMEAAKFVVKEGKAANLDDGVERARKYVRKSKTRETSKTRSAVKFSPESTDEVVSSAEVLDSNDYRLAIQRAKNSETTVHAQLKSLGMARPLDELLNLS